MADSIFRQIGSIIGSAIFGIETRLDAVEDDVTGVQTSLDNKVDDSQVLTDVPAGAVFTDTVYSHPTTHSIEEVDGLQTALDSVLPTQTGNEGKYLKTDGSNVSWGEIITGATDYQEFTTSGTWIKPEGINYVYVEAVGGGGGGGVSLLAAYGGYGHGGWGGNFSSKLFNASDCNNSETIIIGSGGIGGYAEKGFAEVGGHGGDSSFGSLLLAYGGTGGHSVDHTSTKPMTEQIYSIRVDGIISENYYDKIYSGGKGGGYLSSHFDGGISQFAGNGGDGIDVSGGGLKSAENGFFPGGGGGGVKWSSTCYSDAIAQGGNGANGVVRIWCW